MDFSKENPRLINPLSLFLIINGFFFWYVGDVVSTYWFLLHGGFEANPFFQGLSIDNFWFFLIMKSLATLFLFVILFVMIKLISKIEMKFPSFWHLTLPYLVFYLLLLDMNVFSISLVLWNFDLLPQFFNPILEFIIGFYKG